LSRSLRLFCFISGGNMKLGSILLVALLLACTASVAAQAPAKDTVKDWAEQWKMAAEQLLGVAETMPAEKYDYKPVKEVGAFGEQLKHATLAMKVLLANAESKSVKTDDAFAALQKLNTKEEIIAELRKTVQEGAAVIGRIAGKNDGEVVESQFFGKTTRRFLLMQAIAHNNNHYGQLVYYLRMNGLTPPGSR
jgi:uncharacterized damage-inducible protein DinB